MPEGLLGGEDADASDFRSGRRRGQSPGFDPGCEQLKGFVTDVEAFAAAVRNGSGRLQEHQASVGRRCEDATTARFLDDRLIVELRVEAEQRQLESVLPALLSMTTAGVAAIATEQRLDLVDEINWAFFVHAFDNDRDADFGAGVFDLNRRGAVGIGSHIATCIDGDDVRIEALVSRVARRVTTGERDDQLASGVGVGQFDLSRQHVDRRVGSECRRRETKQAQAAGKESLRNSHDNLGGNAGGDERGLGFERCWAESTRQGSCKEIPTSSG